MSEQVKKIMEKLKGDHIIWGVVLMLSLISLLAVYSSTGSLAYHKEKNASYYLVKQLMVLGLGLVITFWVHRINYTKFSRVALALYRLSIPLLLYTLIWGASLNEGARWIKLPVINLTFQTSDLAKLALFMFLARSLSQKQDKIKDLKTGFIPVLFPVFLTCVLIAPANLSTALMLGVTCGILFYIGRVQFKHLMLLVLGGFMAVSVIFTVSKITGYGRAKTWEKRMVDFWGSKKKAVQPGDENAKRKDARGGDDYQVLQAKIAIANGGFTGRGPGNSMQKNFLPHPYSDFIFAIIIEEYGIMGGSVVMLLYLIFLWRSILIFKRCPYAFGAFLAVGLSITLVFQAMLNMAVNVHLVPVTGLTLPMISMGGSSIWFTSIAIGIVLSVSRYVDEMEGERKGKMKQAATSDNDPVNDAEDEENARLAGLTKKAGKNIGNNPLNDKMPVPAI